MSIEPVILPTDALLFLLVAVCLAAAMYISRRPHLALPWRRVAKNPTAMVSLLLMALFLLVGLTDSLHYRSVLTEAGSGKVVHSPQVMSLLDDLVSGLRSHTEKTYSAPLATHLYAMETIMTPQGGVERVYPRLLYGGAHLSDPGRDWAGDVARRAAIGLFAGLFTGMILFYSVRALLRWMRRNSPAMMTTAENRRLSVALLTTTLLLAAAICTVAGLATDYHVFGTDKVGQDLLYLLLKSIRTGLVIGTLSTLVALPFSVSLGVAAGYLRGWVDDVVQYIYTVLGSIPSVLLIAAAVLTMEVVIESHADWFTSAAARADARLLALCVILGVTGWTELCRLLRGEALKLRELEYVQAAQAFGVSAPRIMMRHIVPNVMHIVLISVVMSFSQLVLAEAVLSYIGIGVDPSTNSFGNMINAARMEMGREPMVWWPLGSAFMFMILLVLSANLFADAVRDAFDPRLNRES